MSSSSLSASSAAAAGATSTGSDMPLPSEVLPSPEPSPSKGKRPAPSPVVDADDSSNASRRHKSAKKSFEDRVHVTNGPSASHSVLPAVGLQVPVANTPAVPSQPGPPYSSVLHPPHSLPVRLVSSLSTPQFK